MSRETIICHVRWWRNVRTPPLKCAWGDDGGNINLTQDEYLNEYGYIPLENRKHIKMYSSSDTVNDCKEEEEEGEENNNN